jgi:hypothetical protein
MDEALDPMRSSSGRVPLHDLTFQNLSARSLERAASARARRQAVDRRGRPYSLVRYEGEPCRHLARNGRLSFSSRAPGRASGTVGPAELIVRLELAVQTI